MLVGTDVRWLSPKIDTQGDFYESFQGRVESGDLTNISHVVNPTVIGKVEDRSGVVLDNVRKDVQETRIQMNIELEC